MCGKPWTRRPESDGAFRQGLPRPRRLAAERLAGCGLVFGFSSVSGRFRPSRVKHLRRVASGSPGSNEREPPRAPSIVCGSALRRQACCGRGVAPGMRLSRDHERSRSRRSEARIAVVKGAAFSRACASLMDAPSSRWPITHARRASAATRTTTNPATSISTASIGHMFLYQSSDPSAPVKDEGFPDRSTASSLCEIQRLRLAATLDRKLVSRGRSRRVGRRTRRR